MTDVEKIALWIGLIGTVVSIVLAIVAIVFSILVDRSARAVSAQTIRSLQKIESDVERQSEDTRGLIKAGWDKMLGNFSNTPNEAVDLSTNEMVSGLIAEIRAKLGITEKEENSQTAIEQPTAKVNELLENLGTSLEAQIKTRNRAERPSEALEFVLSIVNILSPDARALAHIVASREVILPLIKFRRYSQILQ